MLTHSDIHKHYIDRQHTAVRRLTIWIMVILAIAVPIIAWQRAVIIAQGDYIKFIKSSVYQSAN